jgi:Pyruvate/2-oxoacid:ferredoxin oxidoreductase delta subunit
MEGDGPHSGTPRKIGAVMASGDYNAIDVATARLMSIDPRRVSTIAAAVERGYLREDFSDVAIVGEPLEGLIVEDYKRPSTYYVPRNNSDSRMRSFISAIKPHILADQCIGCMKCMRSCPVKAISAVDEKPSIDYDKCIRCYCCHEMCDDHAIALERS